MRGAVVKATARRRRRTPWRAETQESYVLELRPNTSGAKWRTRVWSKPLKSGAFSKSGTREGKQAVSAVESPRRSQRRMRPNARRGTALETANGCTGGEKL
jgi:hypothetical protein